MPYYVYLMGGENNRLKGWTRKKKEALIRENEDQLKKFSKKIINEF
ncbi:hypothetical protein KJ839_06495 [Patescibacteria group bacterium]|nr:hypothetical protein [Patescibacteria group bacterium]